ncbi:UNVERIFIED_CONTAM: hypothetical protein FKN15_077592 [Acipenser sinensis]
MAEPQKKKTSGCNSWNWLTKATEDSAYRSICRVQFTVKFDSVKAIKHHAETEGHKIKVPAQSSTNDAELTLCQQQQEYHSQTNVSDMWVEFFKRGEALNLLQIVQHVLAIPPSNVFVDSIFSIMKNLWTDERHRLQVDMVKAKLFVHCKYKMTCSEFAGFLKTGAAKELVAATREEQYNFKK